MSWARTSWHNTGFTQITLQSVNDTVIDAGVSLSPSLVKLSTPVPGVRTKGSGLTTVAPYLIGVSSLSIVAEKPLLQPPVDFATVDPQTRTPTPRSRWLQEPRSIWRRGDRSHLKAPNVTIGGLLSAPAGTVGITATLGDLTLQSGGTISATGYNERSLKPVMPGNHVSYTALPGGSVTLSAPDGSVITEPGSLVDVSGSSPVKTWLLNGNGVPKAQTIASNPGSITISALNLSSNGNPTLHGTLEGKAKLPGLQGGTLSITSLNSADRLHHVQFGFRKLSCRWVRCADFPQLRGADFLRSDEFYGREEPDTRCAFFYGIRERPGNVQGPLHNA